MGLLLVGEVRVVGKIGYIRLVKLEFGKRNLVKIG